MSVNYCQDVFTLYSTPCEVLLLVETLQRHSGQIELHQWASEKVYVRFTTVQD